MQIRRAPDYVGRLYGVTKQTVITWCESGLMPAVNVASPTAKRKRWRMSDDDIETFNVRRANRPVATPQPKSSRRTIARPVKDFFAKSAGAK